MGPDIDLIRRINIWENMNLVGRRVAYRPKNVETNKMSGSGLAVLARPMGIKKTYRLMELIYIRYKLNMLFITVFYNISYIYIYIYI